MRLRILGEMGSCLVTRWEDERLAPSITVLTMGEFVGLGKPQVEWSHAAAKTNWLIVHKALPAWIRDSIYMVMASSLDGNTDSSSMSPAHSSKRR